MASQQIRVAIIGGGLAGALLLNPLTTCSQLDVQLQERGASVGLSINAQRAMRLLSMEEVTRRADTMKVRCLLTLKVFDLVRREHAQEVVDLNRRAAESYFSAWPGVLSS